MATIPIGGPDLRGILGPINPAMVGRGAPRPLVTGLPVLARPGFQEMMRTPVANMTRPTGLAAFLQRPGLSNALMAFGSSMLAQKNQPHATLGSSIGNALPLAMQVYEQGQQKVNKQRQIDTMLQDPSIIKALGSGGVAYVKSLPIDEQLKYIGDRLKPFALGEKERLTTLSGETLIAGIPDQLPSELATVYRLLNIDPNTATEEQNKAAVDLIIKLKSAGQTDIAALIGGIAGITKTPVDVQSAVVSIQNAGSVVNDFDKYVGQWLNLGGLEKTAAKAGIPNAERDAILANIESAKSSLLLEIKNLARLGVLSGPDVGIITELIGDPTSWGEMLRNPSSMRAKVSQTKKYIDRAKQSLQRTYGITIPGSGQNGVVVPSGGLNTGKNGNPYARPENKD